MSRRGWLILAGVLGALVVLLMVFAFVFRDSWGYKTLSGPVAVVKGAPPKHGFLGVDFGGATAAPLTIHSVTKESGADDAGLQPGDVILAAGPAKRPNLTELQGVLQASTPGEELLLKIGRGTDEMEVRVTLVSFADMAVLRSREQSSKRAP